MRKKWFPMYMDVRKNDKVRAPWRWLFVDTETLPERISENEERQRFRLGHAIYWRRERGKRKEKLQHYPFTDIQQFWKYVAKLATNNEPLFIVAHNVKFDMPALDGWRMLPKNGYKMETFYAKGSVVILRFRQGRKKIIVLDSMNYFPTSLKEIGKALGEYKIDLDPLTADTEPLKEYCKQDANILYKLFERLINWLRDENLGSFAPTGAGLAFHIFRHKFMNHKIRTHHIPMIVELERAGYFGGFVHLYRMIPNQPPPYYKLDINSMYPSVMRENEYPIRYKRWFPGVTLKGLENILKNNCCMAEVLLDTPIDRYPYRDSGYVFYPTGEFWTILCTESLKRALKAGHIKRVRMCVMYEKAPLFREYVDYMYEKRLEARRNEWLAYDMFYKRLLASLYGRFALINEKIERLGDGDWDSFKLYPNRDKESGRKSRMIELGGGVFEVSGYEESYYSFPAISAHVTDQARWKIWDFIDQAGEENVYYSDTDSLIVPQQGRDRLEDKIDAYKLGALKIQSVSDQYLGLAKKDIIFDGEITRKGFHRPAILQSFLPHRTIVGLGWKSAIRYGVPDAPVWKDIIKIHEPTLVNCWLTPDTRVLPLELPRDFNMIGTRHTAREYFFKPDPTPFWVDLLNKLLKGSR